MLTINLLDANDNYPEFPQGPFTNPYHFNAPENAPSNVRIGKYCSLLPSQFLCCTCYWMVKNLFVTYFQGKLRLMTQMKELLREFTTI